jgi:hypothetical protein
VALTLSQLDRRARTYSVTTLLNGATVPPSGTVGLGLVPKGIQSPSAATVWTPVTYTAGSFSVLFAGPQADSTGAIVVTADCDLWMLETDAPLVQAVKIERITILGSTGTIPTLPTPFVSTVQGRTGAVVLTAADVGADAAGAATAAQAAAIAAIRVIPGTTQPTGLPTGTEYVWMKTDGSGNLLDILSGVAP